MTDDAVAIPRRTAVAAAGAAGLVAAAGAATACTRYGGPTSQPTGGSVPGAAAGVALGPASDVPVGGGKVFGTEQVVVTQPAAGTFKAFSAVCTHQGCLVGNVAGGTINCTCHGSKFNLADGAVIEGPATTPLPPRGVTVTGDQITLS